MPHVAWLEIFQVRLRLRKPIGHALAVRTHTDNLVVRSVLDDGTVGYGEGVPREYVTGDTADQAFRALAAADWSPLRRPFADYAEVVRFCAGFHPTPGDDPLGRQGQPARCAVELSLLDAFGRRFGRSLSDVPALVGAGLAPAERASRVRYSGVITAEGRWRETLSATKLRLWGFRHVKVKVALPGRPDRPRLRRLRRVLGRGMDVRVDANGAWAPEEALDRIRELADLGIRAVEQPIADVHRDRLPALRAASPIPIMLDESLVSWQDGLAAVQERRGDLFNLRLSKCGGLIACVRLAGLARQHGLGCQLGCQVGESGILSAAGRHFAASVPDLLYLEGSYDRYLVRESLLRQDITFGYGGWAPALGGPGLAVDVDLQRLEACCHRRHRIGLR